MRQIRHLAGRVKRTAQAPAKSRAGRVLAERMILLTARLCGLDLLSVVDRSIGIGKYHTPELTGERHLFECVLPRLLGRNASTLMDIGANNGDYAIALRQTFPSARVIAFEPNPHAYRRLIRAGAGVGIETVQTALGATPGQVLMYDYAGGVGSEHCSLYPSVLTRLHHAGEVEQVAVEVITLDAVCDERSLFKLDFVKIDTEGHELAVLRGAERLLREDRIGVLQIEFNEMNVVSRSFLRDFYDILPRHRMYRLDSRRLIPLGAYNPRNEIFRFQNLLAVHEAIDQKSLIQNR